MINLLICSAVVVWVSEWWVFAKVTVVVPLSSGPSLTVLLVGRAFLFTSSYATTHLRWILADSQYCCLKQHFTSLCITLRVECPWHVHGLDRAVIHRTHDAFVVGRFLTTSELHVIHSQRALSRAGLKIFAVESNWRLHQQFSSLWLLSLSSKQKWPTIAAICNSWVVKVVRKLSTSHASAGTIFNETDRIYVTNYIPFSVHVIRSPMVQFLEQFSLLKSFSSILV